MNYKKAYEPIAETLINHAGGIDNIASVDHNDDRLSVVLKDSTVVNLEGLRCLDVALEVTMNENKLCVVFDKPTTDLCRII